jgi:two-component sensor histidine kinase
MPDRSTIRAVGLNIGVAVAYASTGWLGLQFPYYGDYVTLVWVPTGIALAAVILVGPTVVPGIFLGSFGLNLTIEPDIPAGAAIIAAGNTLAPALTGLVLARRGTFRPQLDRVRDVLAFFGIGVVGTGVITASLGPLWLCAYGGAPWRDYPSVWLTWFGGEAVGSMIVGPLLLTWLSAREPTIAERAGSAEKLAMIAAVAAVAVSIFFFGDRVTSLTYVCGLMFAWILFRTGPRETTLAVAAIAMALVVATSLGAGPFGMLPPRAGMLSLWMFLAAAGGTIITCAALATERDHALLHQKRLVAELDHRVKNTLATVVALAERSAAEADGVDDFQQRLIGRIRAIARTHEGLARSNWEPMKVADVVAMTLSPFGGNGSSRLVAGGDNVTLTAAEVAPLTMVLHELATNAAKHGAWSRDDGRVAIEWKQSGETPLRVSWHEAGGPPLAGPPNPGFGLRLIEGIVGHQLGGDADLDFRSEGLLCTFQIPVESAGNFAPSRNSN